MCYFSKHYRNSSIFLMRTRAILQLCPVWSWVHTEDPCPALSSGTIKTGDVWSGVGRWGILWQRSYKQKIQYGTPERKNSDLKWIGGVIGIRAHSFIHMQSDYQKNNICLMLMNLKFAKITLLYTEGVIAYKKQRV